MGSHGLLVDGVRLRVRVEGEGAPVVLLHGFPDSSALWEEVTPHLVRSGYRVIAPDLRGFGESEAPAGIASYALPRLAQDVLGVMDALQVPRAKLVGHDWGAVLGWLLAATRPERFERFCAISVGHPRAYLRGGPSQGLKAWYILLFQLRGVAEAVIRAGNWALWRASMGPLAERQIADLSRPGRLEAGLAIYRANFLPQLRALEIGRPPMPVLGVWSSGDRFLGEDQMRASAELVQGPFRYERLEGVGHWVPLEAPDALARRLLAFFEQSFEA